MKTHICLVSAQPTANLAPILDSTLRPEHVVLVTSADMSKQASYLETVLTRHGITVESISISDAYSYAAVEDALLDWLAKHEADDISLNVTGGTKLMAMAAHSVFATNKKRVFYVNADTDDILFLHPREPIHQLSTRIRLRDYLEAHGYTLQGKLEKPQPTAALRALTDRLLDRVQSAGKAIGQLNWLAQKAESTGLAITLPVSQANNNQLYEVIHLFEEVHLLELKDDTLSFRDEAARQFVNGGWLEWHVYGALSDIAPETGLVEHAINVQVTYPDGKTSNELDATCLHRNRLHIIETKTANLAEPGKQDSKATDAIYKLQALLKLGGLRTRAMLIDYRGGLSDADKRRATDLGIRIVSGAQLKNIKGTLRHWLQEKR